MSLNQEQFDLLIQNLEVFARKDPKAYKLRVALLATLGYAYILMILTGALALLVGIVWLMLNSSSIHTGTIKVAIFLLIFVLVLLRSLWISFPAPTGLYVKREDSPGLYTFVDELSSKLQAPRFHQILLVDDFNAAVMQRPRLGLLGWEQNYLIIGLPLMLGLTTEQFRAVLAHEIGHLSGNHSRFGGWIYRQRLTWYRIAEELGQGANKTSWFIFERFLKWYVPFFNAYSFVLARMDEYEADRCAVELTGAENVAEMLKNVNIKARFLENSFFSNIYKQVNTEVEAPKSVFTEMKAAFIQEIPSTESSLYLTQALARETNNSDTHPCLSDRLNALQCLPQNYEEIAAMTMMKVSAAREVLGTHLEKFIEHFNQTWYEQVSTPWRQKYAQAQESLTMLKQLENKSQEDKLNQEESWQRVTLTLEFKGDSDGLPLLKEFLDTYSSHVSANYWMGEVLLKQQDKSGIEYVERAMSRDIYTVVDGCQIIYSFLMQQGDVNAAESYKQRAQKHYDKMLNAEQEREYIQTSDKFQPHDLSQAELNDLCEHLSRHPEIEKVYLVQKEMEHFPENPLYVLAVIRKVGLLGEADPEPKNSQMLKQLSDEIEFHHRMFFLPLTGEHAKFEKPLCKVSNALIYSGH
jgi:Zn-dependent protease with chaperone function